MLFNSSALPHGEAARVDDRQHAQAADVVVEDEGGCEEEEV